MGQGHGGEGAHQRWPAGLEAPTGTKLATTDLVQPSVEERRRDDQAKTMVGNREVVVIEDGTPPWNDMVERAEVEEGGGGAALEEEPWENVDRAPRASMDEAP